MNRGRRKIVPSFLHTPTGVYRSVVGAREAEAGRVFVTIENGDSRERLFWFPALKEIRSRWMPSSQHSI